MDSLPVLSFHSSASGSGGLALGDAFPGGQLGQFGVELGHVALVLGHVFFGVDGVDRAFGDADRAVNAFIGVDGQKVGAFAKTVHGADIDTIGVLALDAGFGDGMGHFDISSVESKGEILKARVQGLGA